MSGRERAGGAALEPRELDEALAGLRPEREAFREAVARRLAEAEGRERARAEAAARSPFLRQAAALLPAGLLPKSVASVAGNAGWKGLGAWLAFPALTFAMLGIGPVAMGLSHFATAAVDPGGAARAEAVRAWWRRNARRAGGTLAGMALLFAFEPAAALLSLLLVSAGVLALLLARLRAAGFVERERVARHCGAFLLHVAASLWLAQHVWHLAFTGPLANAGYALLALCGFACVAIALGSAHRTPWSFLTRASGVEAGLLLMSLFLVPLSALAVAQAWAHLREPIVRQLERHVEGFAGDTRDGGWTLVVDAAEALRELGPEPDLEGLRARWRAAVAAEERPLDLVLAAGLRVGFATPEEVAQLVGPRQLEHVLEGEGPFPGATLRDDPRVQALVRSELAPADRARLRERLLASFEAPGEAWALARAVDVAELLERLEPGASRPLADRARALLAASWVPPGWLAGDAGFQSAGWKEPPVALWSHTREALALMRRFGVPAEVDLEAVARGLRRSASPTLPGHPLHTMHIEARLGLHVLRAGLQPVPWPRVLLDWAVVAACGLLGGLCLVATLRAPRAAGG